jgi:hypothetical protein
MSRTIVIHPGYRIRDLVACAVVVILGVAFTYAITVQEPGPALRVPTAWFVAGLSLFLITFVAGAVMDRVTARWPSLIRARRCPRLIVYGLPLILLGMSLREPLVQGWIVSAWHHAAALAHEWWPTVRDFFASFREVFA